MPQVEISVVNIITRMVLILFVMSAYSLNAQLPGKGVSKNDSDDIILPPDAQPGQATPGGRGECYDCGYSELQAEFPGGNTAFFCYLEDKLNLVKHTQTTHKGRLAVKFAIDSLGRLGKAELLVPYDKQLDNELLRVLESGPKRWAPARINRKRVDNYFNFTLTFPYKLKCPKTPKPVKSAYAKLELDKKGTSETKHKNGRTTITYHDTLYIGQYIDTLKTHIAIIPFENTGAEFAIINTIRTSDPCIIVNAQYVIRPGEKAYFYVQCPTMFYKQNLVSVFNVDYNSEGIAPLEFVYRLHYIKKP